MKSKRTNNELSIAIIAAVRRTRIARGLSQTEWAALLTEAGFPATRVLVDGQERRSGVQLGIDEAVAIASVLGLTLDGLVERARSGVCERCDGRPPAGFSCQACGATS